MSIHLRPLGITKILSVGRLLPHELAMQSLGMARGMWELKLKLPTHTEGWCRSADEPRAQSSSPSSSTTRSGLGRHGVAVQSQQPGQCGEVAAMQAQLGDARTRQQRDPWAHAGLEQTAASSRSMVDGR